MMMCEKKSKYQVRWECEDLDGIGATATVTATDMSC